MKQYSFDENKLILKVSHSPLIIRLILFVFSFLFFLLPVVGIVISVSMGSRFHISFLFLIFVFGLLGFYLLRIALWNTYGCEKIIFNDDQISYLADYGWFKDKLKTEEITNPIYSIKKLEHNDVNGTLVIVGGDNDIECVTKMSIIELEKLIIELKKKNDG